MRFLQNSRYWAEWLKLKLYTLPSVSKTLQNFNPQEVLKLDKVYSFVKKSQKKFAYGLHYAREPNKLLRLSISKCNKKTYKKLCNLILGNYRHAHTYSDFWKSYSTVFSQERHTFVRKKPGLTNRSARWNYTLRQRIGRFV